MKLLIASDLHGSLPAAERIAGLCRKLGAERLILLGDLYYHGPRNPLPDGYAPMEVARVLNAMKDELIAIRGNCDAEVDELISEFPFFENVEAEFGGRKIFLTHGHRGSLPAPDGGCELILEGHTHLYGWFNRGGCSVLNPGSAGLPKGGNPPTVAVLTETEARILRLDGSELDGRAW